MFVFISDHILSVQQSACFTNFNKFLKTTGARRVVLISYHGRQ